MIPPEKILIFRKSSLGDVLLTLPVIQALMNNFPAARIDYLTKTRYAPLVEYHPGVDHTLTFDNSRTFRAVLKKIRSAGYDLFIDLQANLQSRLIRAVVSPARTARYKKRRLAREIIVRRPQMKLSVDHTVNAYLGTLRRMGINAAPSTPIVAIDDVSLEFAAGHLQSSMPSECQKLIAVCPGARYREKRWPSESFRAVTERLLEDATIGVLLISSDDDEIPADLGLDHPRLLAVRDFEILRVAALLRRCRVSLTNDSGIMHLSCAVGTPVLSIFGPTNPRLGFSPTLPGSGIICDDVFCSPCSLHGQRPCRQREKYCFKDITVERVLADLRKMI